jgi:uncharacterized protein YndB with AHSA1/START domain
VSTDGELVTLDGRPALRFVRSYRQPVDRVWRAVTEPEEMAAWFPSGVIGERAVGAELLFDDDAQRAAAAAAGEGHRDDGGEHFTGRVVAWDPPKVFSFSWGGELLRFELHPDDQGTRLVFTQVLSHRSVAARNGSGWHSCLRELDSLLGAEPAPEPVDDWQPYRDFLRAMGPEPGTPGADGSRTWELGHHVPAERVRDAVSDPDDLEAWGAVDRLGDDVHWDIRSGEGGGSVVTVTVQGAAADPELATAWHTLLVQLDLYLAAGIVAPLPAGSFDDLYR